jgi:ribonuclease G
MLSLYLFFKGTEKVALAVEREQMMEVFLDRPGKTSKVGNMYKGIVRYVDKGLQAAFVDFGDERQGFLQRQEIPACKQNASLRIEQAIQEGQTLLVQVQKDAHGTKGAKLSAIITLPGQVLVYLPNGQYVAVSKKLPEERAEQWKTHFTELLDPEEGVIVRTEADQQSETALSEELQLLRNRWKEIAANDSTPPAPIFHDALIPDQLLRRIPAGVIEEIIVDDGFAARQLRQQFPSFQEKIKWEKEAEMLLPQPLAVLWEQLISPVVHIDRGITLHIEQTEALTVIDVNSAGYKGHSDKQQTAVMVNQLAAKAIAREMRLRNLSGIILIDFVSMNRSDQQRAVLQTFRQALHQDSQRTEVYGFTKLGILEVSRKRERPSILNQLQKAVKPELSLESRCFQLERDLLKAETDRSYVLSGKKAEIRRFVELTKRMAVSASVYVRYQDKAVFKLEEIDEETVKRDGLESLDNLF